MAMITIWKEEILKENLKKAYGDYEVSISEDVRKCLNERREEVILEFKKCYLPVSKQVSKNKLRILGLTTS
ncbi:MAG: hypothetical protein J7J46_05800 [Candidatus Desulfofervidus sp.]|nr:hypothetical protein [Candidatus Desulfofervidus sp.]